MDADAEFDKSHHERRNEETKWGVGAVAGRPHAKVVAVTQSLCSVYLPRYLGSGRHLGTPTVGRYWPDAKRTCDTHPPSDVVGWVLDAVAASIYPSPVTQRLDFWPSEDAFLGVMILRGALLPMGNTNQDLVRSVSRASQNLTEPCCSLPSPKSATTVSSCSPVRKIKKRLLIHVRETQRHCKPAWLLRW